jgi:hypothetical protein
MLSNRQTQILLGVVLVIILLSTTLVAFFVFMHLGDPDEKYKESHSYDVSGYYGDYPATGEGVSGYVFEPHGFVYMFTTTYSYSDGQKGTVSFSVICDSKEGPSESLYEYVGSVTIDDKPCKTWKSTDKGKTVVFSIDGDLVVHQYKISDNGLELEGKLKHRSSNDLVHRQDTLT